MSAPKPSLDWESMEREYRLGKRSLRDIGKEFGCGETAIRKHAKRNLWARDLSAKVRARAVELVRKAEVRNEVRTKYADTERGAVESDAVQLAGAEFLQRGDLRKHADLVRNLFLELEATSIQREILTNLANMVAPTAEPADEVTRKTLLDTFHKVLALPGRIDSAKRLAEALRILIELQRKVLRMDADSSSLGLYEDALRQAQEAANA